MNEEGRQPNFVIRTSHFALVQAWLVKIIGQNHQFLGVNNAIASMLAIRERSAGLRPAEGGARLPSGRLARTLAPPTSADVLRLTEPRSTANPNGIGVFWQTQSSGKSFSRVFFAQKVLRKVAGNWTFVVVTGRLELNDQMAKTCKATGAVSEAEGDQCHAVSGAHLRELLPAAVFPLNGQTL